MRCNTEFVFFTLNRYNFFLIRCRNLTLLELNCLCQIKSITFDNISHKVSYERYHHWKLYTYAYLHTRMCVCIYLYHHACVLNRVQLFVTPLTVNLSGSLAHGTFQARILEWIAISSSRRSSWLRNWTHVSISPVLPANSLLLEP